MIAKIKNFLTVDVWRIRRKSLSTKDSFLISSLRTLLLAVRGFAEDKCQLRASALTFYSLLSIVPVAAMAFGIAKGFGFEKKLEQELMKSFQGQEEVIGRVVEFAQSFLMNTKGGVIAGIGVILLFWTVIKVLGNIEHSFNDIWGIKTGRTLIRKFSDYLAIMLICPVLVIASSSMTVFITSQVSMIVEKLSFLGPVGGLILFGLKFLPFVFLWLVFSFIYLVMPNTKVNIMSGVFAGVLAGSIYQFFQWVYITFQIGAAKFGAIYGSFAALPLFLFWLQVSWLVVLFGAELSFAHQNVDTYELEPDCLKVSHSFRRKVALTIVSLLVKRFVGEEKPLSAEEISHELEMPIRLIQEVLFELVEAGILIETKSPDPRIFNYQPAKDSETLTVSHVLKALDENGTDSLPMHDLKEYKKIDSSVSNFQNLLTKSSDNLLLKDI